MNKNEEEVSRIMDRVSETVAAEDAEAVLSALTNIVVLLAMQGGIPVRKFLHNITVCWLDLKTRKSAPRMVLHKKGDSC